MRRAQRRDRAAALLQLGQRLGHRLAQRAAGAQQLPFAGQRLLVIRLGRQRRELLHGMAQEILVAPRGGGGRFGVGVRLLGGAPGAPGGAHRVGLLLQPGEGIERGAMGRHVQEAVLLHLALDLDQRVAEPAQQRHRYRLVVDEGAAAAVGADQAAQGQHVLVVERLLGQHGAGRMVPGQVERGRHRGLVGAPPHRSRFGAGAQRQAERIDQDRLAGAGLAGERAQSALGLAAELREKSRSSFSIRTKSRIESETSMQARSEEAEEPAAFSSTGAGCPRRSSGSSCPGTSRCPGSCSPAPPPPPGPRS